MLRCLKSVYNNLLFKDAGLIVYCSFCLISLLAAEYQLLVEEGRSLILSRFLEKLTVLQFCSLFLCSRNDPAALCHQCFLLSFSWQLLLLHFDVGTTNELPLKLMSCQQILKQQENHFCLWRQNWRPLWMSYVLKITPQHVIPRRWRS